MKNIVKLKEIYLEETLGIDAQNIKLIFDNGFKQIKCVTDREFGVYKELLEIQNKVDIDWNIISKIFDICYDCGWEEGYRSRELEE